MWCWFEGCQVAMVVGWMLPKQLGRGMLMGCNARTCMPTTSPTPLPHPPLTLSGRGACRAHPGLQGGDLHAHQQQTLCPLLPTIPQGVALAARTLGCKAVICMPTNSPEIKINAVKELGGIVELVGESFYEAQIQAQVGVEEIKCH